MLVLIALFLALNCVSNFSNSSDSRGIVGSAPGSSSTPIFESTVEAQTKTTPSQVGKAQYKAVQMVRTGNADRLAEQAQRALDEQSSQGWVYVGSADYVLIFKK